MSWLANLTWRMSAEALGALARGMDPVEAEGYEVELVPAPGSTVVLPVGGVIVPSCSWSYAHKCGEITALAQLKEQIEGFAAQANVERIVLRIRSGGGLTEGLEPFCTWLETVPNVDAFVDGCACSAAYQIAAACRSITVAPLSQIGSIGTKVEHVSIYRAEQEEGIDWKIIASGEDKAEGSPHLPLSADAEAHIQEFVDADADVFFEYIARRRNVSVETIKSWRGRWWVVGKAPPVLFDSVGTLESIIGGDAPLEVETMAKAKIVAQASTEPLTVTAEAPPMPPMPDTPAPEMPQAPSGKFAVGASVMVNGKPAKVMAVLPAQVCYDVEIEGGVYRACEDQLSEAAAVQAPSVEAQALATELARVQAELDALKAAREAEALAARTAAIESAVRRALPTDLASNDSHVAVVMAQTLGREGEPSAIVEAVKRDFSTLFESRKVETTVAPAPTDAPKATGPKSLVFRSVAPLTAQAVAALAPTPAPVEQKGPRIIEFRTGR